MNVKEFEYPIANVYVPIHVIFFESEPKLSLPMLRKRTCRQRYYMELNANK